MLYAEKQTRLPVNTHVNSPLLRYSQFADKPPRSHKANAAANTFPPVVDAGSALELATARIMLMARAA